MNGKLRKFLAKYTLVKNVIAKRQKGALLLSTLPVEPGV